MSEEKSKVSPQSLGGQARAKALTHNEKVAIARQGAKEAGKMRLEGKEYIVQDGDVMHFRFNV